MHFKDVVSQYTSEKLQLIINEIKEKNIGLHKSFLFRVTIQFHECEKMECLSK